MTVSIFPAASTLPSVVGQAGNFLSTNGTSINWSSPVDGSRLFAGFAPATGVTFTNLNVKNSISLVLGNWSTPGGVTVQFNRSSQGYNNVYGAWNGSSSGQTESDVQTLRTSIISGNMFNESPATFIQIEGCSSTGPKLLRGWSQSSGSNNMWAGIWEKSDPINSITISTSNSVGFAYRMVIQ
jgi:hypothetical protein